MLGTKSTLTNLEHKSHVCSQWLVVEPRNVLAILIVRISWASAGAPVEPSCHLNSPWLCQCGHDDRRASARPVSRFRMTLEPAKVRRCCAQAVGLERPASMTIALPRAPSLLLPYPSLPLRSSSCPPRRKMSLVDILLPSSPSSNIDPAE